VLLDPGGQVQFARTFPLSKGGTGLRQFAGYATLLRLDQGGHSIDARAACVSVP
jgi:hypothetical protein